MDLGGRCGRVFVVSSRPRGTRLRVEGSDRISKDTREILIEFRMTDLTYPTLSHKQTLNSTGDKR